MSYSEHIIRLKVNWKVKSSTVLNLIDSAASAAKSLQSCPTLCDPIDSSPPGSPVPGIFQARTLEWAAISFSIMNLNSSIIGAGSRPENQGDFHDLG